MRRDGVPNGGVCYRLKRNEDNWKVAMALIKLRKANQTGEEVGSVVVNTDQIVAIVAGQNVSELQMVDGPHAG